MARVVVGMSGGVDSAVAALLLKRAGHDVTGLFMKNWEDDDLDGYCPAKQDLDDVLAVADVIGIPVEGVNFAKEYKDRVFSYFLAEYRAGRTPNPDILCNSEIKFKAFLDHAIVLGADYIATGHYARIIHGERHALLKAADRGKDQSYFLYRLSQAQLHSADFPLGEMLKAQVRQLAKEAGLPVFDKKDSTGICFIGERPFREFLERYLPRNPGEMRSVDGALIGQHDGLMYYTIGQRQGLHIGGAGEAWFVANKDVANNTLIVAQGRTHSALYRSSLRAVELSWVSGTAPAAGAELTCKTRYRQTDVACRLSTVSDQACLVTFAEPHWAVTPGQSIVFYDGDVCLGGGVIE